MPDAKMKPCDLISIIRSYQKFDFTDYRGTHKNETAHRNGSINANMLIFFKQFM